MQRKKITASSVLNDLTGNTPTYFIIQEDYTVTGNVQLAPNSVLHFSGGKLIINGNLGGDNTVIDAPPVQILQVSGTISGSWHIGTAYPEWFGAVADGQTDCSPAIAKAMCLGASELRFSCGIYNINSTIVTTGTNIYIAGRATIYTNTALSYMIQCDYSSGNTPFGMKALKTVCGGGGIDGNYSATCGIAMRSGYRTVVRDITIKNINGTCLKTTFDETKYGPVYVQGCVFQNPRGMDKGSKNSSIDANGTNIAILNNCYGNVFENLDIVNFKVAVKHKAENATYNNVHAWLFDGADYWFGSKVFSCYVPDVTLYRCDADTMQSLVVAEDYDDNNSSINHDYFFANILNCQAYRNPGIANNTVILDSHCPTVIRHPKVIDMGSLVNSGNFSQIMLVGGNYYYDNNEGAQHNNDPVVYEIMTKKSDYDIISINRFNRNSDVLVHYEWY